MSASLIIAECSAANPQQGDGISLSLLECITENLDNDRDDLAKGLDMFFLIYASSLMFFMQAGFAMLCAGCVRYKNVQNTMLKNLLDVCGAAIGFWSVGYAFAYGGDSYGGPTTFIGTSKFFMIGVEDYSQWLYQFAFAATSATIVAGTLAERSQMVAYLCYSVLLTGFVYPVIAHSMWSENGFLSAYSASPLWDTGVIDFAGSGVVHMTGGFTALIATIILGPRKERFHDDEGNLLAKARRMRGHSITLQVLGTFILWFGWFGFNSGSFHRTSTTLAGNVASLSAVNTTLSCAAGCITVLSVSTFLEERRTGEITYDLTKSLNGCLSGCVAVTANCAIVEPWAAVITGSISGFVYLFCSDLLVKFKIDDAVDAIPVHLGGGIWGVIAVGLFASPDLLQKAYGRSYHFGLFYSWSRGSGDATLLAVNALGLLFILGWVLITMTPFFMLLSYAGWFRADPLEEIVGLDISYHGGAAPNSSSNTTSKSEITEMMERIRNSSVDQVVSSADSAP